MTVAAPPEPTRLRETPDRADRPPPVNVDAEQSLLGAILNDNRLIQCVSSFQRPEHFGWAVHGRIYAAAMRLIGAGQPANPVTLKQLFDHDEALKDLGGAKYLAQLATAAPTLRNTEFYGRIIFDLFARREIMAIGRDLVEAGDPNRDLGEIKACAKGKLDEIGRMAEEVRPRLRPLTAAEFLALDLPPRELILDPWLPAKGLGMLHSLRGFGKTHLALGVGYAVASGGALLGWSAPEPRRVIYLDGEMPATAMQRRLAAIVAGFSGEPDPDYFRLLSADIIDSGLPDLGTEKGQREIDAAIGKAELIIVDNISTLVRSGKENEAESWLPVQGWALAHRRAGRSVLFIHHAGKGGLQRGTSRREDVLDTVITLRRPVDYTADQGARFEVVLEKGRGIHGDDARPFEARYEEHDGAAIWTRAEIADAELTRVADALRDGMSIREAAEALGMHKSKVERLKRKAAAQGLLDE